LTIEIDILSTKDDVAILFHDVTLGRLFDIEKTVYDVNYQELSNLIEPVYIPKLSEVLDQFPSQKFLLDIRTDLHTDLFFESHIKPEMINLNPLEKLIGAIKKIDLKKHCHRLTLMCGALTHKQVFKKHFPYARIQVAERYARDFLDHFKKTSDASFLGNDPESILIHNRRLSTELIEKFHEQGIRVIATPPTRGQSVEKSVEMINNCFNLGADGILTSPVDSDILTMIEEKNKTCLP
jgi:glycerophosphoryl diester phosphodiesterase